MSRCALSVRRHPTRWLIEEPESGATPNQRVTKQKWYKSSHPLAHYRSSDSLQAVKAMCDGLVLSESRIFFADSLNRRQLFTVLEIIAQVEKWFPTSCIDQRRIYEQKHRQASDRTFLSKFPLCYQRTKQVNGHPGSDGLGP